MRRRLVTADIKNNYNNMNQQIIAVSVAIGIFGGLIIDTAQRTIGAPIHYAQAEEAPRVILIEAQIDWTQDRIKKEIDNVALEHGVSAKVMHTVIKCESNYNARALGDGGKSRGLVQIHSGYHAVPDEDAYNPAYAVRFLAEKLKNGQGNLWSCYNMNYK